MEIDVTEICKNAGKEQTFSVTGELTSVEAKEAVAIEDLMPFELTVANTAGKRLTVSGKTQAVAVRRCDRCLKEVRQPMTLRIERSYPIEDEAVVPDADDPLGGVTDNILFPDELLRDEILISLPSKALCRDDCKGLCPVCGADLNDSDCGCERQAGSLQMAKALEGIVLESVV